MKTDVYVADKVLKSSGKVISDTPAPGEGTKTDVIDVYGKSGSPEDGKEGQISNTETAEQLEATRIAAQATMTPDEVIADNQKHADSLLTPEDKEKKEFEAKAEKEREIETAAEARVLARVLKDLGVNSIDEIKNKIPAKPETNEEKAERENNLKANVAQYAVKNKILTMDEITSFESMKKSDKRELAYSAFAKDYREEHKDRFDPEDATKKIPVTEAEIEDSFNDLYHVNSDNPALKKTGEKLLDGVVKAMLGDTEAKYNDVVEEYKEFEAKKGFYPEFKKFYTEVLRDLPAELTFGEGENKVVFKTDKIDKTALEEIFSTNEAYNAFYDKKGEQKVREQFKNAVRDKMIAQNIDAIIAVATEIGIEKGLKKAPVGAKAPFDENKIKSDGLGQQKVTITAAQAREGLKRYANPRER